MKLNGALKPRQGASKQGSSPGVVLKRYRVKRYFMVNENVVNGLPLNACGVRNNNLTKTNNNNNKNICINNQQQARTPLSLQLEQKRKCGQIFRCRTSSSSSNSSNSRLNRINYSTLIKTKKQTYLIIQQKPPSRVSPDIKVVVVATSAAENSPAEALAERNKNKRKEKGVRINFMERAVINITTRQVIKTKLNEEKTKNNTNNIRSDDSKTKQNKHNLTHFTPNKELNNKRNIHPKEVNKFLFIPKFNENLISRLLIQLKLLLFSMFAHATKHLKGNPFVHCPVVVASGKGTGSGARVYTAESWSLASNNLSKMMRASQFLERICFKNAMGLKPSIALCVVMYAATAILLPQPVVGDDGDTFYPINGLETTTPEFDYASRGQKKFGDKCENTLECGFPGSICDPKKKSCQCTEDLPVTNHIDKCGKEAAVNESCFFNEQCEVKYFQTECRDQKCVCRFDMTPVWLKDGSVECKGRGDKKGPETYIDPAMIGVLVGMALMFIIICVVLRLFSQARWRENRTIFNTPNPRLMNVSLLRESKLLHGQERRGSRMSVRAPSRQPSMASLRPHSPNPSLGRMTRSKSNTRSSDSRVSDASNCSRLFDQHQSNTHHTQHPHANAISPHATSTSHGPQASISPVSLHAPATIITNVNQTPVTETIDCNTSPTMLPTAITNKPNKF